MSAAQNISRNTLVLGAQYAVSYGLRIGYLGVLARYVGPEGIGQIGTATALVSLAVLVVNFGLEALLVRDVAADPARAGIYVTQIGVIRAGLAVIMAVALALVVALSHYSAETQAVIGIYALTYLLDAFSDVARGIFQAFQRLEYKALTELARDVLNVAASLAGIALGWSLVALVAVSAAASLAKLALSVAIMAGRFARPTARLDLALCRALLLRALPFAALMSIGVVNAQVNAAALSWLGTARMVGIYTAAAFPITVLVMVGGLFMDAVYPHFARLYGVAREELTASYRISYKAMLVVGFPLGVGMLLVGPYVVELVYGPGFDEAALVLRILAVQLFTMVGYVNGAFLNATGRQVLFAVLRAVMTGLNVVLCVALIPGHGCFGAAAAASVPAGLDFGLYTVLCHRDAGLPLPWALLARTAASAVLMGSVCYTALHYGAHVALVALLLAPALYGCSLVLLHVIDADERRFLAELLPRWVPRLRQTRQAP